MELNWLLLLSVFLLHIKQSRMSPTRMVCDRRLIQKYITEAVEMAQRVSQCEELPSLQHPVLLPLVGVNLGDWRQKTARAKGQEVLGDLSRLVGGTAAARQELTQGCACAILQQLYEKASSFLLHLQNFGWQEQDASVQPEGTPQLIPERNLQAIFETYERLVRGKLRFLFADLRKDSCGDDQSPHRATNPIHPPPSLATSWGQ
ncbi:thrombopoietin isoform X2 [Elgaria multicarinata webbii]|uniref:thrombopoietin isoform X2 n=1 Tax=Elgaria multicarinata webbii TaxID=159646 RepID=UPI002FCD31C2